MKTQYVHNSWSLKKNKINKSGYWYANTGCNKCVCCIHMYAKKTDFSPDVHGKIYFSTLMYAL